MKYRSLGSGCAARGAAFIRLLGSSIALLGLNLAILQPAHAVTIDFEELDITTSGSNGVDLISSKGYDFANPGNRVDIRANDQPNVPNSGSKVMVASSVASSIIMSRTDGTPFSFIELLIAEGRNTNTFFRFSATSVSIVGTLAAGGTVQITFNLDLFAQESLDDFEMLPLSGFNDVLSVTFTGLGGSSGNSFAFDDIVVIHPSEIIELEIDIKPRSDLNSINLFSRGVIPVAILGSDTFDVADVEVTTLAFGPDGSSPGERPRSRFTDVDRDGFEDLVLHFRTSEAGIAIGDTEACLTGETLDGTPFEGCDTVETLAPPGSRP